MKRRGFLQTLVGIPAVMMASSALCDPEPAPKPKQPKTVMADNDVLWGVLYTDGVKEVVRSHSTWYIDPSTFQRVHQNTIDSMTLYRAMYVRNLTTGEIVKSRFNDITEAPDFSGIIPVKHGRHWRGVNYES